MILQRAEGGDLSSKIWHQPRLTLDRAVSLGAQLLAAVRDLHAAGAAHRDIKPGNILLDAGHKRLWLADLGCAVGGGSTRGHYDESTYMVTRWYRPPELAVTSKEENGPKSLWPLDTAHANQAVDMWSVGCVLAEMLTGLVLLRGDDSSKQMKMICDALGPPPSHVLEVGTGWLGCF